MANKELSIRVLELERGVVVLDLDLYRYDDVGEGAVTDEWLATLLDGCGGLRLGMEVLRLYKNQLFIAVVVEKEGRVACSGLL